MARKPDIACSACGRGMYSSLRRPDAPLCRTCLSAVHGREGMYRRGCRCAECRDAMAAKSRRYTAKRIADGRPIDRAASRPRAERVCEQCGNAFASRLDGGPRRFCGVRCANIQRNRDRGFAPRPPQKSAVRRRAERVAARAAVGTVGRLWVQGACRVCGDQFTSPGAASRYCSSDCRSLARRSSNWVDYLTRLEIYRSAGWCCQLCKQRVSRRYSPTDPLSPTLDHIVPRAHGGTDEISNLRLLCMLCNSKRSDLSWYSDAELAA